MGKNELKRLPSAAERADGSFTELDCFTEQERAELEKGIYKAIGQSLSVYYSDHPEEWEAFIRAMD